MSFKNLTVVDRKVYREYKLTLRERRVGYEVGALIEDVPPIIFIY